MKNISLTKGKITIVDDDDYDFLMQWKWYCGNDYAQRNSKGDKKRKIIYMHRVINKTPDGLETDHINGDYFDNRKENLRSVTQSQNQRNTSSHKESSSKYKGVSLKKGRNKWEVRIKTSGIYKYIGLFEDETTAAKAYNEAAIKYFGEFAKINRISTE